MSRKSFNGQLEQFVVISKNSRTKEYAEIFFVPKITLFTSLKNFLCWKQLEQFVVISKNSRTKEYAEIFFVPKITLFILLKSFFSLGQKSQLSEGWSL